MIQIEKPTSIVLREIESHLLYEPLLFSDQIPQSILKLEPQIVT
jgi:hypothetical protein